MAVVLRSNTDLVYLPDHGIVGEEGALRVLPQITPQIHRLNLSYNDLGPAGTLTLFKGITTLRTRYSSPEHGAGLWGLHEVTLSANLLDDTALDGVLAYAKKDVLLAKIYMQGNQVTLQESLDSIVLSLNSSHVGTLSLTNNPTLDPAGFERFLAGLNSTYLRELHLAACNLPPAAATPLADFLRSPRSRSLELLVLDGNQFGQKGVTEIVDAIEENYALLKVGMTANHRTRRLDDQESAEPHEKEAVADELQVLEYQVHQRLAGYMERNQLLTRRVKLAASRTIAPARVILNALPPSDSQTARRVIDEISSGRALPPFRLLDLPEEVIHLIVRHVSGDPWALSEEQFTRLRVEASDRAALRRACAVRAERMRGKGRADEKGVMLELRQGWLKRGRWDRWEKQKPAGL
ncbi:hypothetical protein IAT38_000070 [Cryptococcus sp. DSM 104549]